MTLSKETAPDSGGDGGRAAVASDISGAEIKLDGVTKRFPGQKTAAVDGLSLTIPAGEIVMFVGPSGCGKTTSLKMINRLVSPTSGTITIDGRSIKKGSANALRRKIGYVIQGGSLFPHLTVAENIATVPKLLGWKQDRTAERVDELLDLVGLDPARYRNRYPRELSGGQQQRVGVARGLAADPPVILMDEPFGAVDPITRQRLQDELISIQRELRKTIVCVTHDIDEAIKLGDRILILREGAEIAQYDTPENILAAPASDFVADFVGAGSTLKALSLARIADLDLAPGFTARVGEPISEVFARAQQSGADGVVVLDGRDRPVDWVRLRELRGQDSVPATVDDDLVTLDQRATLNDALDTMLTSSYGSAIVTGDRDRFLGLVDFDTVVSHMRATEQAAQEAVAESSNGEGDPS